MIQNYDMAINNIRRELREYLENSKLSSLVLGISGGIDSALCAVLAKPVCDELQIPLIGRSITIVTNKAEEIERARDIGRFFTTDFEDVNLSAAFENLSENVIEMNSSEDKESTAYKIRLGNVKARTRMIYLYDLASKNRGMVLSTDNYTELLLGFWTLHGDVGDYGMIQNLWKTEVYEMARHLASEFEESEKQEALQACIDAVATDGLGITNSDLDQIKAKSYEEVDQILLSLLRQSDDLEQYAKHPVVIRKLSSEFKRENPFNIARNKITNDPTY